MDINFTVTDTEASLIVAALGELPYKAVADLITKLRVQAAPQLVEEESNNEKILGP